MNDAVINRHKRQGCLLVTLFILGIIFLSSAVGVFFVNRAFTNFDAYRDTLCLKDGLIVSDEHLRYSIGFDDAMWCAFTALADSIDDVFDQDKVDTSQFDQPNYRLTVEWITNDWWDVEERELIGGEVDLEDDVFMRVGYVDNEDGTLSVYIFWFEV